MVNSPKTAEAPNRRTAASKRKVDWGVKTLTKLD
jgi:hypothetical protein